MDRRSARLRWLAVPAIALLAVGLRVSPASADDVLILDQAQTKNLQFTEADGEYTGALTVTNTGPEALGLRLDGTGDLDPCDFTLDPSNLEAQRTATVAIKANDCTIPASGGKVTLDTSGAAEQSPVVLDVTTKETPRSDLVWIALAFVLAALCTLIPIRLVWSKRPWVTSGAADLAGAPVGSTRQPSRRPARLADELPATDPKFSFSESWATSISAGATVFVALVGSTDVLTLVFGEKPEELIGQILVAGAVAGLLIGLAPLILKAVGPTEAVTVRGLLLGGFFTLTGVSGQILSIGWAVREADDMNKAAGWGVLVLALLFAVFLWFYGYRTLTVQLKASFRDPGPTPIPIELIAAVAASTPDLSPEEVVQRAKALADAKLGPLQARLDAISDACGGWDVLQVERRALADEARGLGYSAFGTSPGDRPRPYSGVL